MTAVPSLHVLNVVSPPDNATSDGKTQDPTFSPWSFSKYDSRPRYFNFGLSTMMETSMISHGLYDLMRFAETAAASAALRVADKI